MRKQGVEDYRQKLLSHEGWSGDSATGHRGLPAKEKEIANAEHWVYDAFLGKPYVDYINAISGVENQNLAKQLIEKIRIPAEQMSATQRTIYNGYLNEVYKNARKIESALPTNDVLLPASVTDALSIEKLLKTELYINALKNGTANIQEIIQFLN